MAEKLALEQRLTTLQERVELEKLGFQNRIEALQDQKHRLNDIQRLQLENVKKQFLKRLVIGEMALIQSDMEKQHLLQRSALNEIMHKGQSNFEDKMRKLDNKVKSAQRNLEKMRVLKERIEKSDSLQMLREYDSRLAEVYRHQQYYYESAKRLDSFQKESPEWILWRTIVERNWSDIEQSEYRRKTTFNKLANLLKRNSWDYRSQKYLD